MFTPLFLSSTSTFRASTSLEVRLPGSAESSHLTGRIVVCQPVHRCSEVLHRWFLERNRLSDVFITPLLREEGIVGNGVRLNQVVGFGVSHLGVPAQAPYGLQRACRRHVQQHRFGDRSVSGAR